MQYLCRPLSPTPSINQHPTVAMSAAQYNVVLEQKTEKGTMVSRPECLTEQFRQATRQQFAYQHC